MQKSELIFVGDIYYIKEHDTKIIVVSKEGDKSFVSLDIFNKTNGFWIRNEKLEKR